MRLNLNLQSTWRWQPSEELCPSLPVLLQAHAFEMSSVPHSPTDRDDRPAVKVVD